ncbi:hypothetical protein BDV95DRAFT_155587 [Massariosphaeria phaeospora]|uniref:Uncharacterized protein n=1 Tax=Massariosphaeria phaeospora TaxID=100035 RepID=A0A7C8MV27_9PLEO|nr:hypothetical protein BDV95DRAFT_155587 [Massariosphaeria phaeospora]
MVAGTHVGLSITWDYIGGELPLRLLRREPRYGQTSSQIPSKSATEPTSIGGCPVELRTQVQSDFYQYSALLSTVFCSSASSLRQFCFHFSFLFSSSTAPHSHLRSKHGPTHWNVTTFLPAYVPWAHFTTVRRLSRNLGRDVGGQYALKRQLQSLSQPYVEGEADLGGATLSNNPTLRPGSNNA